MDSDQAAGQAVQVARDGWGDPVRDAVHQVQHARAAATRARAGKQVDQVGPRGRWAPGTSGNPRGRPPRALGGALGRFRRALILALAPVLHAACVGPPGPDAAHQVQAAAEALDQVAADLRALAESLDPS